MQKLIPCLVAGQVLLAAGSLNAQDVDTSPPDTLRVLAYNIHHGEGMDEVIDLARIAELIRSVSPDVVALQEIDSVAARTDLVDQALVLAQLTGLDYRFGRFMAYDGGAYGMAILSAWPIVDSRNIRLPDGDEPRSALSVVVASPSTGRRVGFVGIHFYRTLEERFAQASELERQLLQPSDRFDMPQILAGDFNSTPEDSVMQYLGDLWHIVDKGEDHYTFSSFEPTKEIDFVLVRPLEKFVVLGESLLDEPVASDHRPVVVDLVIQD